jgi:hypothetical protein
VKKGRFGKKIFRRSGFEDKVEANLKARGVNYTYESSKLCYTKLVCPHCNEVVSRGTYTPDFFIERCSRVRLVVECKGYLDSPTRTLMQRVKRDNPTEDIRFVFQRDNLIRRGSKTSYLTWAHKNGFPAIVGTEIPSSWINETQEQTEHIYTQIGSTLNVSIKNRQTKRRKKS